VVGDEEQPVGLNGPDGRALLADHLADLGALKLWDDPPGALDAVVVSEVQGVPARAAEPVVANLRDPRPHLGGRRIEGDGP